MTLALLFAVAGLLCAGIGFAKEPWSKVAVVLLAIATIIMAVGANTRLLG